MKKPLLVLLVCIFVVMIGFGIVLPVLPFYVERLALAEGATRQTVVVHVGLLTAVYALMQLVFAPLNDELGSATQFLVQGALQQWLGELIQVNAVQVETADTTLQITVQYMVRRNQQLQVARFSKAI